MDDEDRGEGMWRWDVISDSEGIRVIRGLDCQCQALKLVAEAAYGVGACTLVTGKGGGGILALSKSFFTSFDASLPLFLASFPDPSSRGSVSKLVSGVVSPEEGAVEVSGSKDGMVLGEDMPR
jgi:hypothetical protein